LFILLITRIYFWITLSFDRLAVLHKVEKLLLHSYTVHWKQLLCSIPISQIVTPHSKSKTYLVVTCPREMNTGSMWRLQIFTLTLCSRPLTLPHHATTGSARGKEMCQGVDVAWPQDVSQSITATVATPVSRGSHHHQNQHDGLTLLSYICILVFVVLSPESILHRGQGRRDTWSRGRDFTKCV
jgi:hypothetical protein